MVIIDPAGLFNGDRLRMCSDQAKVYWPFIYSLRNAFGRFEINVPQIIGTAFHSFVEPPTPQDIRDCIAEYARNFLLFLYVHEGTLWGQWDVPQHLLPKYQTKVDKRTPCPPPADLHAWRQRYVAKKQQFVGDQNFFLKLQEFSSRTLRIGEGIGEGEGDGIGVKPPCSSGDERGGENTEQSALFPEIGSETAVLPRAKPSPAKQELKRQQAEWFGKWWDAYWRKTAKADAWKAFQRKVTSRELFDRVLAATETQCPAMLGRDPTKRPHGATWLNGERWEDEEIEANGLGEQKQSIWNAAI
jgi:hypothetical protein